MKRKTNNNQNMSPQLVPCPRWVQRRMRANLAVAARSKVNRNSASIAKAILDSLRDKQQKQTLAVPTSVQNNSPILAVPVVQVVQPEIRTERPKLWSRIKSGVGKLAHNIFTSLPARRLPQPAHH